MTQPIDIPGLLAGLVEGQRLSESDAEGAFGALLAGAMDQSQIAAMLSLIQARGVTADELTGAARVMRSKVERVPFVVPAGTALVDTCGTGGAPKTFNVSTAAAFVVAGARPGAASDVRRVMVAKHGNRSRTGRGSAEVLDRLGVNIDAGPEVQARCLDEAGVCFCFAIHHHPAMKHAAPVRRALGFPTVFNLLGPLTNPAGAKRQLIGVYRPGYVHLVAEVLRRLGAEHAMVVHSDDGLDELTVTAPVTAAIVRDGVVSTERVDAGTLGMARCGIEAVRARDDAHAAEMVLAVLRGDGGPVSDMVLLTSAAALVVAGAAATMAEGIELGRESVSTGRAKAALEALARASNA